MCSLITMCINDRIRNDSPREQTQPAPQLEFSVEDQFKCPLYRAHKPEWVKELNKASDPIIERVRKSWKKKIRDPKDPTK